MAYQFPPAVMVPWSCLSGPLVSHPSPRLTTLPPPKAWACPPALFLGSPPIPTLLPTKQAQQQRSRVAERAESTAAEQSSAAQSGALLLLITLRGLHPVRAHTQTVPTLAPLDGARQALSSHSLSHSVRPSTRHLGHQVDQPVNHFNQAAIDRFINQFTRRSLARSPNLSIPQPLIRAIHQAGSCSLHPSLIFFRTARILHLASRTSHQSNPIQSNPAQSSPVHPPPPLLPQINSLRQALPNFLPHTPLLPPPPTGPSPPDPGDRPYNRFKNNLQPSGSPPAHCLKYLRDHGKATLCLSENNPPWPPDNPFQPGTYARPAS